MACVARVVAVHGVAGDAASNVSLIFLRDAAEWQKEECAVAVVPAGEDGEEEGEERSDRPPYVLDWIRLRSTDHQMLSGLVVPREIYILAFLVASSVESRCRPYSDS